MQPYQYRREDTQGSSPTKGRLGGTPPVNGQSHGQGAPLRRLSSSLGGSRKAGGLASKLNLIRSEL